MGSLGNKSSIFIFFLIFFLPFIAPTLILLRFSPVFSYPVPADNLPVNTAFQVLNENLLSVSADQKSLQTTVLSELNLNTDHTLGSGWKRCILIVLHFICNSHSSFSLLKGSAYSFLHPACRAGHKCGSSEAAFLRIPQTECHNEAAAAGSLLWNGFPSLPESIKIMLHLLLYVTFSLIVSTSLFIFLST